MNYDPLLPSLPLSSSPCLSGDSTTSPLSLSSSHLLPPLPGVTQCQVVGRGGRGRMWVNVCLSWQQHWLVGKSLLTVQTV